MRRRQARLSLLRRRRFNSRTLGRVRLTSVHHWELHSLVSIHAPWEGCDSEMSICDDQPPRFQFTHPGKGATFGILLSLPHDGVSIHAPWEGCDAGRWATASRRPSFNSRTLGRVRLARGARTPTSTSCFNSRTLGRVRHTRPRGFLGDMEFQFTHPGKGATTPQAPRAVRTRVSIHAPWEGCDGWL